MAVAAVDTKEHEARLYKPWQYIQNIVSFKIESEAISTPSKSPFNLSAENPGDKIPMYAHDRLVNVPQEYSNVSLALSNKLPDLGNVASQSKGSKHGAKGLITQNPPPMARRSKSSTSGNPYNLSTQASSPTPRESGNNGGTKKHATFRALNPIRYKLFLQQLTSERVKTQARESSGLYSPSETSLLSTRKPTPKPWIGIRFNLKQADPVVFSPVLVTDSSLLDTDPTSDLSESHRFKMFTCTSSRSASTSSVTTSHPANSANINAILSQANESLLSGHNTMHACKRLLERSSSRRSSSVVVSHSSMTHTHYTKGSTVQDGSAFNSPYDSVLLEFADENAPYTDEAHYNPHQRALMKAQDQKIQRIYEALSQKASVDGRTEDQEEYDSAPSFASYYVQSRRSSEHVG